MSPIPSLWYLINSHDLHNFIKGSFNFPQKRIDEKTILKEVEYYYF